MCGEDVRIATNSVNTTRKTKGKCNQKSIFAQVLYQKPDLLLNISNISSQICFDSHSLQGMQTLHCLNSVRLIVFLNIDK
jgi:hypothetical protein